MRSARSSTSQAVNTRRRWIAAAAVLGPLVAAAGIVASLPGGRHSSAGLAAGGGVAPGLGVVEVATPWLARGCGRGCWGAYLGLAAGDPGPGSRLAGDELDAALAAIETLPAPAPLGLAGGELRRRLVDGLAIGDLLDGIAGRTLEVAVVDESRPPEGGVRRKLLFWDPRVGSFEALLLLPAGTGPHPAVLGLHGHRDRPEDFAAEHLGDRLAAEGFAVLMPRFRVHDCSVVESYVARALLRNGRTLIGLRVYETLRMYQYLRHLGAVDGRRVGLLGHSGGASAANLTVRLAGGFGAHVVDYQVDYRNFCGLFDVHCETVPALVPLAADVNDFATLEVPSLVVPYKFADPALRDQIVAFFRRHLAPSLPWQSSRDALSSSLLKRFSRESPKGLAELAREGGTSCDERVSESGSSS